MTLMHLQTNCGFHLHPKQIFKTICTQYILFVAIRPTWLFSINFLIRDQHKGVKCVFFKDNFSNIQNKMDEQKTRVIAMRGKMRFSSFVSSRGVVVNSKTDRIDPLKNKLKKSKRRY